MALRVLIVEHEPVVALDLEDEIREAGYEVIGVASRGGQALAWIQRGRLDLILVDVDLPGAAELTQEINNLPDLGLLILASNTRSSETGCFSERVGAVWLVKPFSVMQFDSALRLAASFPSSKV